VQLNSTTSKETYSGNGTPVGGVLGPDNVATSANGGKSSYVKQSDTHNNALGTLTQHTVAAPGQVRRMTVAVVLDQKVAGSADTTQISNLVSAAAGLNPQRGDVVTVTKMPFDTTAAAQAQKDLEQAASDKRTNDLLNIGKTVGLILLLGLALFVFARRSRRVERTPVDLGELEAIGDPRPALARSQTLALDSAASTLPALPPLPVSPEAEARVMRREEIGQLIEDQPDEVAKLIRGWLVERRP
jgi:flagellar M-ring protein FliF